MNKNTNIIKFNEIKEKTGINVLDYNSGIYFFNNPDDVGPDSFFYCIWRRCWIRLFRNGWFLWMQKESLSCDWEFNC